MKAYKIVKVNYMKNKFYLLIFFIICCKRLYSILKIKESTLLKLAVAVGLEPTTHRLTVCCPTNWAMPPYLIYFLGSLKLTYIPNIMF